MLARSYEFLCRGSSGSMFDSSQAYFVPEDTRCFERSVWVYVFDNKLLCRHTHTPLEWSSQWHSYESKALVLASKCIEAIFFFGLACSRGVSSWRFLFEGQSYAADSVCIVFWCGNSCHSQPQSLSKGIERWNTISMRNGSWAICDYVPTKQRCNLQRWTRTIFVTHVVKK